MLLKLRAKLEHLGKRGAPLDPRVNRTSQMNMCQKEMKCQVMAHLCVEICSLVFPNSEIAAAVSCINQNTRLYTPLGTGPPSIAPSSFRNSASSVCASSAAKYLAKRILWSDMQTSKRS